MNDRYRPGDYEARHVRPVWQQRANFIITADIASSPESREWEQLWVRQISSNRFEICCIPFFVYDLALGDEVETDDGHVLQRIVHRSGHCTFRVWFGESKDPDDVDKIISILHGQGGSFEWSSEHLLAIDAPTDGLTKKIAGLLSELHKERGLLFEFGNKRGGGN